MKIFIYFFENFHLKMPLGNLSGMCRFVQTPSVSSSRFFSLQYRVQAGPTLYTAACLLRLDHLFIFYVVGSCEDSSITGSLSFVKTLKNVFYFIFFYVSPD